MKRLVFLVVAAFALCAASAAPQDKTTTGAVTVEPPTLISLGFEWRIEGDENRNSVATIAYREQGAKAWREGLPLLRLQKELVFQRSAFTVTTPNMFAGSLFDLKPGAEYEVRLRLSDPDGLVGEAERIVTARTRTEPMPATGGAVYHVYPPDFKGAKQEPSFTGLLPAYFMGSAHADWSNVYPVRVKPGDTILVHAGLYKDNWRQYGSGMGTVGDGTYYLTASGTAERPIVIKAAGDGEVIFDGDGAANLFNLQAANYNYFEGLTIRNTDLAFLLGHKNIAGASGFTLKRSKLTDIGVGVMTDWHGSKNFYIADNTFVGRGDAQHLTGWTGRTWRAMPGWKPTALKSEYAVKVYGSGHVIAYNSVANFHDGIDHATYGDPNPEFPTVSNDVYNNDITNADDNCIEADGSMYNFRVLRNRCANFGHRALSTQPVLGGPAYFIRNIVYNAPESGALKLTADSTGVLIYQNTLMGEAHSMGSISNVHFRNNLFIGQGAFPEIFQVETYTNYSSSDYNGFVPKPGAPAKFGWVSPAFTTPVDYTGKREDRGYADLAAYRAGAGQDKHSVVLDYSIFNKVTPPGPDQTVLYDASKFDFGLRAGSKAVDAGTVLPNITDGFFGRAPDLGALERGAPPVHYGPR